MEKTVTIGSSPRVRGPDRTLVIAKPFNRFIPACAGTRESTPRTGTCGAVHPRVCGDQPENAPVVIALNGSSPRVRGPVQTDREADQVFRFIPACAGTSNQPNTDSYYWAVHPRVCGDQESVDNLFTKRLGSSPRVRGPVIFR